MKYFLVLRDVIDNIPVMFIWNMDEISHSNWVDAYQETVYVPGNIAGDQVPIDVNRAGKRTTLVGCICLDGRDSAESEDLPSSPIWLQLLEEDPATLTE
jgi:hypothetical protein